MADATPNPPSPAIPGSGAARTLDYRGRGRGNGGHSHHLPGTRFWGKVRAAFTRESLKSAFKTFLWAAPLTVLIWIYAERDGEETVVQYPLVIAVHDSDPHRRVHLTQPADSLFHVDLKGPRAQVERLQKELSGTPLSIDVDPNMTGGTYSLPQTVISNNPAFVDKGITVSNIEPQQISVYVDPIRHINMEVKAPPSANLAAPPSFVPRTVHVHIPQSLLDSNPQYGFGAFVQLDGFPDIKTPGTHDLDNAPVAIYRLTKDGPEANPVTDPAVTVDPTVVKGQIVVKNSDLTYEIPILPVWPTMETDLQDKYKVVLGDPVENGVLQKIAVVGPSDEIDQLSKAGNLRPFAGFEVDPRNQQPNTIYHADIHLGGLPSGFHIRLSDPKLQVSYQLQERNPGG